MNIFMKFLFNNALFIADFDAEKKENGSPKNKKKGLRRAPFAYLNVHYLKFQ